MNRRKFIKLAIAGLIGGTGIYALINDYRNNNVLDIVTYPDPALRKVSTPIDRIDEAVISLAKSMIDTLRFKAPFEFFLHASLYKGLSAPQVGIQKRLTVCDLYGEARAMVNPKILDKKGSYDSQEYCMSLPQHRRRSVKRSNYVKVGYRGLDNREHILDARGSSFLMLFSYQSTTRSFSSTNRMTASRRTSRGNSFLSIRAGTTPSCEKGMATAQ